MQDSQLTIGSLLEHGARVYAASTVRTFEGDHVREATYAEVAERSARLAGALAALGIVQGDRVGTFLWNTQEHLEAYFAVPSMGAVLHTLNLRLFPEQLSYVVNHGQDRVVLVDATVLPALAKVAAELTTVEAYVLVGDADGTADTSGLGDVPVHRYEDLLAAAPAAFAWPELDERMPMVVPMFHANAWGLAYSGWMAGADFVMPGRFLQAEPMARMISELRPTVAGAVPTIWNDLLAYVDEHPTDLTSLRLVACGGSAVPLKMMQRFEADHGMHIVQAWGMTETSPLAAIAHVPARTPESEQWTWRSRTGRITVGVDLRLVDDAGTTLPWDGESVGEIQVRGPWITGAYHLDDDPEKFMDGWLRTGDVAVAYPNGMLQITDRSKDVIKSGGEWISSVELENTLMGHPAVFECAVVAVPDERWDERPLACVVLRPGQSATPEELRDFLSEKVARWQLPERWTFIEAVPKTSVGKFDKKVLRKAYAEDELPVSTL